MRFLVELVRSPLGVAVALQLGWWVAVLGAANGAAWAGPAIIAGLLLLQTRWLADRELVVSAALLAVIGSLLDSLQVAAGLIEFRGESVIGLAPLWITALWAHFATALDAFDRLCRRRLWALALCGGIGGPLAYLGGARLAAASIPESLWPTLISFGIEWAIALPAAIGLRRVLLTRIVDRPATRAI